MPVQPGNIGHNAPPEDIGLPPYGDEEAAEIKTAIAETRVELAQVEPDPAALANQSRRFAQWGKKLGVWLAKKGDLAVDEFIKSGVKRSEEHTSELQSLMRISYAVFCLKKNN